MLPSSIERAPFPSAVILYMRPFHPFRRRDARLIACQAPDVLSSGRTTVSRGRATILNAAFRSTSRVQRASVASAQA